MMYLVENRNPVIGPKVGDKQSVSVYDRNIGNRRTVVTTSEVVDEFVSDRSEAMKHANSLCNKIVLGTVLVGAVIGAAIGAKKSSDFCNLFDALNQSGISKRKIKPSMKGDVLEGTVIGSMVGFLCGLPACIIPEKADEKITNEFIENNK